MTLMISKVQIFVVLKVKKELKCFDLAYTIVLIQERSFALIA